MILVCVDGLPPALLSGLLLAGAFCYVWAIAKFIVTVAAPWFQNRERPHLPMLIWLPYFVHLLLLPYLGLWLGGIIQTVLSHLSVILGGI